MPHFSRLTDIVTCSLTEILESADDPAATLREVIEEMEEGLLAARRSATAAAGNRDRLQEEINQHASQAEYWHNTAKASLKANDEAGARDALARKVEIEDLIDGLKPEVDAAQSTHQHMLRIQKALEARHSDAIRRLTELTGETTSVKLESETAIHSAAVAQQEKNDEIEAELESLRREMGS
jgi:phage shock protein A